MLSASYLRGLLAVTLVGCACLPTLGQPVPSRAPNSTHIYPAGGRRGQSVTVRVGAECLPPGAEFTLLGRGVRGQSRLVKRLAPRGEPSPRRPPTEIPISYPKEWQSEVTIAADAPRGPAFWRLSCAQGGTICRPFMVGDLPEYLEQESNSSEQLAERVAVPLTINGQICGERDMDYYRFRLEQGQTVVVDVYAARLGSRFDPIVEIRDPDGEQLRLTSYYLAGDPILTLQAERTGDYLLRLANVSVHGSPAHVYRINLTTKPFVRFAVPSGGTVGQTRELELAALGSGQRLQLPVRFPDTPGPFIHHHGSLAAPLMLYAEQATCRTEREPNHGDRAETCAVGEAVYGSLADADDVDWFRIQAERGEQLAVECHAFPAGSAALPVLRLYSLDRQPLAVARCVESSDGVCRLVRAGPKTGELLVRVSDLRLGGRGGEDFLYRLSVSPARPDFVLTLDAEVINAVQGTSAEVAMKVRREGGFSGEIQLLAEGLPDHVEAVPSKIEQGKSAGKLILKVGDRALSQSSPLRIVGVAEPAGRPVRRAAARQSKPFDTGHLAQAGLFLTVAHKSVFRLYCSEAYLYAHRGSVFPYPMQIERLNGFTGDVQLQIGDRQNRDLDGIQMLPITVPAGQSEFHMPIYLPESMHINIQSQSQLYTQAYARFKDEHGRDQSVLVVSEKRNMLRTRPPVAKLTATPSDRAVTPGQTAAVRFRLKRTTNFPGTMRVSLFKSSHSGVSAEPALIPAGGNEAVIRISTAEDLPSHDTLQLTFRGQGDLYDGVVVVSEAQIELHVR